MYAEWVFLEGSEESPVGGVSSCRFAKYTGTFPLSRCISMEPGGQFGVKAALPCGGHSGLRPGL